jgi:hypothetical protein
VCVCVCVRARAYVYYAITVGILICTLYAVALSVVGGDLGVNLTQLFVAVRKNAVQLQSCYNPIGFHQIDAPRFLDSRHMKVLRLSALRTGRAFTPRKYSWYTFLLEAESTPEP